MTTCRSPAVFRWPRGCTAGPGTTAPKAGAGTTGCWGGAGTTPPYGGRAAACRSPGDGDDLLLGGQDRDLLFAGAGADRVVGNADDDVLVAGTTAYDEDRLALALLRGVWVDPVRTYEQRVAALRSADTLPGGVRLDA